MEICSTFWPLPNTSRYVAVKFNDGISTRKSPIRFHDSLEILLRSVRNMQTCRFRITTFLFPFRNRFADVNHRSPRMENRIIYALHCRLFATCTPRNSHFMDFLRRPGRKGKNITERPRNTQTSRAIKEFELVSFRSQRLIRWQSSRM